MLIHFSFFGNPLFHCTLLWTKVMIIHKLLWLFNIWPCASKQVRLIIFFSTFPNIVKLEVRRSRLTYNDTSPYARSNIAHRGSDGSRWYLEDKAHDTHEDLKSPGASCWRNRVARVRDPRLDEGIATTVLLTHLQGGRENN